MAIQILNNNDRADDFRGKLNANFAELNSMIAGLNANIQTLSSTMSALQAEATAKWVLLNDIDNRVRQNTSNIAALMGKTEDLIDKEI